VAQLQPQTPASLFVAFYDSHGYGGGILTSLHTEKFGKYVPIFLRKPAVPFPVDGGDMFPSAKLRGVTSQKRTSNFRKLF
jgi:hypothetical protein